MPVLLKCKADEIMVNAVPLPHQPSSPLPVNKCPQHDQELVDWMHGLLRMGARWLDTLQGAQMATQEASGVMAVAIFQKQG